MFARCRRTVASLIVSSTATSRLEPPAATAARTSASRAVSPPGSGADAEPTPTPEGGGTSSRSKAALGGPGVAGAGQVVQATHPIRLPQLVRRLRDRLEVQVGQVALDLGRLPLDLRPGALDRVQLQA